MALSLSQKILLKTAPPTAAVLMRALACTWRLKETGAVHLSVTSPQPEPRIYVYWHEFVLGAVGHYRDQRVHPFASRSFDGELISRAMHRLGFGDCARGSSSNGGAPGLLALKAYLDEGRHVSITLDGPRGPRRVAQRGAVKLAQLSGRALVPFVFGVKPAWRATSWDRMLLPAPFMRGVVHFGDAIFVPRKLENLDEPLALLQQSLNTLDAEAGFP